jgi:hypothetical protein
MQQLPGAFDGTEVIQIVPDSNVMPAYAVIKWNNRACILFAGTNGSVSQVNAMVNGWARQFAGDGFYGANRQAKVSTIAMYENPPITGPDIRDLVTYYIAGHSYGGLFAQALGSLVQDIPIHPPTYCWTYGQPRSGNTSFRDNGGLDTFIRWFGSDDPVRYIPPHADEVPFLYVFLLTEVGQDMNRQVQGGIGMQIGPNGGIFPGNGDPGNVDSPGTDIVNWILGSQGYANSNHAIMEYRHRFDRAIANAWVPPPGLPTNIPDLPLSITNAALQQIRTREEPVVEAAIANGTMPTISFNVNPNSVPAIPGSGPTPTRYKVRKYGRLWTVTYAGNVVAVGPGKRHAKTIRRRLNRTLATPIPGI